MLRKYNIAYLPDSKANDIIQYSKHFSKISDQYQLGDNSLPHVTVCQFYADEKEIEILWNKVIDATPSLSIQLEFKDFSCITFDNTIHWFSLMPDQREILSEMHEIVKNIVNPSMNKVYDPHMTLISTKDIKYKMIADQLAKSYSPISDDFVLSLGECDAVGQLTRVLHKSDVKQKISCRI